MAQLQLPMFPAGVTEINNRIAVEVEDGRVCYIYGHLPVFQHEKDDVRSFRMFTSQMIVNGTVKPKEIVETFGVPMVTVKRYVKVYRDHGTKGFYERKPRHSSASVLKGEVLDEAQRLLPTGQTARSSKCWPTHSTSASGVYWRHPEHRRVESPAAMTAYAPDTLASFLEEGC